jgi:hypothetical protein
MGYSAFRPTGLTFHNPAAAVKGYTLVTPMNGHSSYLLDIQGRVVHEWRFSDYRGFYARLLPSGNLALLAVDNAITPPQVPEGRVPTWHETVRRIGGNATHLVEFDWDSNEVWQYANPNIHHDFARLPNGNTVLPEFVEIPADLARSVRGGYRERFLPPMISDDYIEVARDGKEVRRVHLWKLLDPVRDPICSLERRIEWTHSNSIDVTPDGSWLFSTRQTSRVGLIDTSGKLVWKYGFPDVSHQHHATVLPNGNVQIFDNGMHRRGVPRSSVVEVDPKTSQTVWSYTANPEVQFLSANISSAERMAGGNVLVCEGATGRVFEVTSKSEVVWEWVNPFSFRLPNGNITTSIFRAHRYAAEHPALTGRELDPRAHAATNRMHGLE